MTDVPDLELQPSARAPEPPRRSRSPILAVAVAALVVAVAAYFMFGGRSPAPAEETQTAEAPQVAEEPAPLGGQTVAVDVPPLDESDSLVRTLVTELSAHPQIAAWLTTDGLIRNFTVVVANISDGQTPATHLRRLRPSEPFRTVTRDGRMFIDPRSFERYDARAAAVTSIDPEGAAKLYATLKPRIEEAYRDLGHPDTPFDRALERAITTLLAAPIPDGDLQVEIDPKGIGYRYANPELEALSQAQKLLVRTGPANARAIQASLRRIALALGIPGDRLAAPRSIR